MACIHADRFNTARKMEVVKGRTLCSAPHGPRAARCTPHLSGCTWWARAKSPAAHRAAHGEGRSRSDPGGVWHPQRIRRRDGDDGVLSGVLVQTRGSRLHCPSRLLAQIWQCWSKKQISSVTAQTFVTCIWVLISRSPFAARPPSLPERQGLALRLQRSQYFPYAEPSTALLARVLPPSRPREKPTSAWHYAYMAEGVVGRANMRK